MQLTKQQENLIKYILSGANIIGSADAGTGKTTLLQQALLQIYVNIANENKRSIVLQFNTKNRDEWINIIKAIKKYINTTKKYIPTIETKTYHQLGYNLLQKGKFESFNELTDNWEVYQYFKQKNIDISKSLIKSYILVYEKAKSQNLITKKDLKILVKRLNIETRLPKDYDIDLFIETITLIYQFGQKAKKGLSTSDMVCHSFLNKYKRKVLKYDVIFLDEYQDLNFSQINLIKEYAHEKTQFVCVGDGKQQVNLFQGSLLFEDLNNKLKDYFNIQKELKLTGSFRNPQTTLDYVNKLFGTNTKALTNNKGKLNLESDLKELFNYIDSDKNVSILCAQNEPLRALFVKLLANGYNPIFSGFNMDKKSVYKFIEKYKAKNKKDLKKILRKFENDLRKSNWIKTSQQLKNSNEYKTLSFIKYSMDSFDNLEKYKEFLLSETPKTAKKVFLSTCHKAKGLTLENVFIIEPQLFDLNEEMNIYDKTQMKCLHYVALTRNKKDLCIIPKNNFTIFETK